ncbi:MAG: methyltransferase domain-containing protein [Nanoarchaeota archaeon]
MKKLNQREITARYDEFAKRYKIAEFFTNIIIGRFRKRLLEEVRGKVLEIGIGTGANLQYYSVDCKVIGIDMSKEMIKRAKIKADKIGKKVELKIGDASKLPFENKEFDYVIDALGMCSYPNPLKTLREMKRVCKKNGKILLLEHGMSNNKFIMKLQEEREEKHYSKIGCSLLRNSEELVKKAGLKIIKCERKVFGIIYIIIAK